MLLCVKDSLSLLLFFWVSCTLSLLVASFAFRLNLYGFQRLTRGRDRGGYYHELFLKDRVFLSHSIQRIKVKGTGVRARSNPDEEPDFFSMPWVQPRQTDGSDDLIDTTLRAVSCEAPSSPDHTPLRLSSEDAQPSALYDDAAFGRSSGFFSRKLPLHMGPTVLSMDAGSDAPGEDDVLFGKHFFDVPSVPPPLFDSSESPQDSLLSKEVDQFFEDFDFPDDIGNEIEDDEVFGALLEQMIS